MKKLFPLAFTLFLVLLLAACSTPGPQVDDNDAVAEVVAATLTAVANQPVNPTPLAPAETQAPPTINPNSPLSPDTEEPGEPAATEPAPTEAAPPSPTAEATETAGCNLRATAESETPPDGTVVNPGEAFVKSWTLRNTGTCTWEPDYALVPFDGPAMSQESSIPLGQTVAPDGTVTVSADLVAPQNEGEYESGWKLRTPTGQLFGIGNEGETAFVVRIEVEAPTASLDLGEPDWIDTFEGQQSRWFLGSDDDIDFEIEDGVLIMTAEEAVGDRWRVAFTSEIDDAYIEAEITSGSECSGKDGYGLLVRAPNQDDGILDSGYVFTFSCDGEMRFYRMDSGEYTGIQNWTDNPAFRSGPNETNTVGVLTDGSSLLVYTNNQLVAEYSDSTYDQGRFGLIVRAEDTPGFEAEVDQIAYWNLP